MSNIVHCPSCGARIKVTLRECPECGTLLTKEAISRSLAADVDIICSLDIVRGFEDGTLRPAGNANRAQAATMIIRMLDALETIPDIQTEAEETP